MNITNPFTNNSTQLAINNPVNRIPLYAPSTSIPNVPNALTITLTSLDITDSLSGMQSIQNLITPDNNPIGFNVQQQTSLNNIIQLFQTLSAGATTFTQTQLQDIVIVSQSIRNLVNYQDQLIYSEIIPNAGVIVTIDSINSGSGYLTGTYNSIPLSGGSGTGALANFEITVVSSIASINNLESGSGYLAAGLYQNVSLSGGSGIGATANITVGAGTASNFTITNGGSSYGGNITVIIDGMPATIPFSGNFNGVPLTGGSGSGAIANLQIINGIVAAITIANPGISYSNGDSLSVNNIYTNNAGSGFAVSASVTDGIQACTIVSPGENYVVGDILSTPNTNLGNSGSGFSVTVSSISNTFGEISSITIQNGGFGYIIGDVLGVDNVNLGGYGTGFSVTVNSISINPISVINSAFPNGAQTCICNDGYGIVELPGTGQFWVSNNQDFTTWQAIMFATSESRSDTLLAIDYASGYIILFGTRSMEYWQDQGTTPFPYQRVNGAQQDWGLAAIWSRAAFQNSLAFLGQNFEGQLQILTIQGFTPTRISNSDIEHIINGFTVANDAFAFSYTNNGHDFYQITFPTANRSFLYDGTSQAWSEVQSSVSEYSRHIASLGISFNTNNYVSDYANGNIYYLDNTNPTDNGYLIRREFDSKHVIDGGNSFGIDELYLDMARGIGTQNIYIASDSIDPKIELFISKDQGETFGKGRVKSLGLVGQYISPRQVWRKLGNSRDFVFKFIVTSPVAPFVINYGAAVIRKGTE